MDLSRNNHQSGQNQIVLIHRHHFHQNLQHFEFLHLHLMDHHLLLLTDILLLTGQVLIYFPLLATSGGLSDLLI